MKKIFALLMILVLPILLLADVASYVSKADAEKGASIVAGDTLPAAPKKKKGLFAGLR